MVPAKMRGLINGVLAQDHLTVVPAALHPVVSKWIIRTDILSNSLVLLLKASLVAQMVKSLPAVQDTWVRSLGQEDPLEEGMATHSSTVAWRIPCTGKSDRLLSMGSVDSYMTEWQTHTHSS